MGSQNTIGNHHVQALGEVSEFGCSSAAGLASPVVHGQTSPAAGGAPSTRRSPSRELPGRPNGSDSSMSSISRPSWPLIPRITKLSGVVTHTISPAAPIPESNRAGLRA